MKKLRIVIPLALAVIAITVISFNVASAQGDGDGDSNTDSLATKVAEILGLDAAEVSGAIKQAREELMDETFKEKLSGFVQRGQMTKKQADEYIQWIQSRPEGLRKIWKHSFGKSEHEKQRFGARDHFKKWPSFEEIEKKLNAMVENGDITQEEADAKMRVSH